VDCPSDFSGITFLGEIDDDTSHNSTSRLYYISIVKYKKNQYVYVCSIIVALVYHIIRKNELSFLWSSILMELSEELSQLLQSNGASAVGIADMQGVVPSSWSNCTIGISIGVALDTHIISEINDGPTELYYAEYKRVNHILNKLSYYTEQFLQERGYLTIRLIATNADINYETLSTRLPHKTIATRAGLGWIGKCALLITRQFGSAIRITTVLTNAKLPVGVPIESSDCGECMACVNACPGHAPSGRNWRTTMSRDAFFNAFACQQMAREQTARRVFGGIDSSEVGIDDIICGICIAACPWTQKYLRKVTCSF